MACKVRIRYVVALAAFFAIFLNHCIKNVTNVTLVAMTGAGVLPENFTNILMSTPANGNKSEEELSNFNSSNIIVTPTIATHEVIIWDHITRNFVQGSFFYGYIILQLPSGRISEFIGSRMILGPAVMLGCVLSFLFPFTAQFGVYPAAALRFTQGLLIGVTFPCVLNLFSRWTPISERSWLLSLIYSGSGIGLVVIEVVSGYLSASNFLGGWPSLYYLIGIAGIVWFVFWTLLVRNNPETHPLTTAEEVAEINKGRNKALSRTVRKIWTQVLLFKIATSIPFYALITTALASSWTNYVVATQQPEYLTGVLGFEIQDNGVLSALPHVGSTISSILFAIVCDKLRKTQRFSVTFLRKFFNSIVSSALQLSKELWYQVREKVVKNLEEGILIEKLLSIYLGSSVNHVEMSPTFAGTLMGIANCISNIPGFLVPMVTSKIVGESKDYAIWGKLFYLTAVIDALGGLIFCLLGSSELQSWDPEFNVDIPKKPKNKTKDKTSPEENNNNKQALDV
ncbi:sialin-like [Brevipalpus obovatus]|uniref:sialin-like n=1 Tax=Brevipalpus obovatus TaxID=246614 RepID=UPI003D9FA936